MRLASGPIGSPPFLVKALEETALQQNTALVDVNPATAKDLGLAEGSAAVLSTPKGSARVKVHLSDGIMPGLVALPRGLGHTAYDKYLAGKGVNTNALDRPGGRPRFRFRGRLGHPGQPDESLAEFAA